MISRQLFNSCRHHAKTLARELENQDLRIVFAESATAGLVAATLAQVPGISQFLCGSAVTYQESCKHSWLNIDEGLIEKHSAVSPQVTRAMARSVLQTTPAADFSVAITGHLEPQSDNGPIAYVVIGYRNDDQVLCRNPVCFELKSHTRINRQWEAAGAVLETAHEHLRCPQVALDTVDWEGTWIEKTNFPRLYWF